MPAKIPDETLAQILAETNYYNDEATASRWGVSRQTITRARRRASVDPELSRIVAEKLRSLEGQWITNAVSNLNAGLIELRIRYGRAVSRDDAECITAIANSLKIVGELKFSNEALNDSEDDN